MTVEEISCDPHPVPHCPVTQAEHPHVVEISGQQAPVVPAESG